MQEAGFCGKTDPEQLTVASAQAWHGGGLNPNPQKVRSFVSGFCLVGGVLTKNHPNKKSMVNSFHEKNIFCLSLYCLLLCILSLVLFCFSLSVFLSPPNDLSPVGLGGHGECGCPLSRGLG